ncbi:MAG: rRNA adenine N-6-methyltransferase family protein [Candidatus Sericytochromatia bacterium]
MENKFIKNVGVFLLEIAKKPGEVGAIAPSSKNLGNEITDYIKTGKKPVNIIEVGPGTGVMTEVIAKKLKPHDKFDVIEYNPQFVEVLKEKFKDYPNIHVHCVSIIDWKPDYKYDYMVSCLPFNVFAPEFVEAILKHYEEIMKKGSMISYFEYMVFPKIKKAILNGDKKDNFQRLHNILSDFRNKYEISKRRVYKNFPPAYVYNLKMK